ncbi:hypothetical protein [uncultured Polaribacter sp.]|uniref:hypothetical protein n=1 Tax=uncultured Polaribacter sp. TaxID=174711 RepID=UPI0026336D1A|nr:hypothetical protein [uncultured Polaribacter sp.]
MILNQICASGKDNFISELTKKFSQRKKEILGSDNVSEKEKKAEILALEKWYHWKRKLAEYCNF